MHKLYKTGENFVKLTMVCVERLIVQNGTSFYAQTNGIVTWHNNSVSIGNISLYHIVLKAYKL